MHARSRARERELYFSAHVWNVFIMPGFVFFHVHSGQYTTSKCAYNFFKLTDFLVVCTHFWSFILRWFVIFFFQWCCSLSWEDSGDISHCYNRREIWSCWFTACHYVGTIIIFFFYSIWNDTAARPSFWEENIPCYICYCKIVTVFIFLLSFVFKIMDFKSLSGTTGE